MRFVQRRVHHFTSCLNHFRYDLDSTWLFIHTTFIQEIFLLGEKLKVYT